LVIEYRFGERSREQSQTFFGRLLVKRNLCQENKIISRQEKSLPD
jgi:hypothetical protein